MKSFYNDKGEKSMILRKAINCLLERVEQETAEQEACDIGNIDYTGEETEGFSILPCDCCRHLRITADRCVYIKECSLDVKVGAGLRNFRKRP